MFAETLASSLERRVQRDGIRWVAILMLAVLWPLALAFPALAQDTGSIFAAHSYEGSERKVFNITSGQLVLFAQLPDNNYLGSLSVSPDGRLIAVTDQFKGSVWDITAGGDFTLATPLASNLFPAGVNDPAGLAFDADGNAYISNGDGGLQPIAVVAVDGSVSQLIDDSGNQLLFDNPRGLAVLDSCLFIVEGGTGNVLMYDLTTNLVSEFATGFTTGRTNIAGSSVVDQYGELLVLWNAGQGYGIFDITTGGDFSGEAPLVPVPPGFYTDVNQLGVDSANNLYVAGGVTGIVYRSVFDGSGFSALAPFAQGLTDTEAVTVVLP